MLAMLANGEKDYFAHPMFWAPFVVVGEGVHCPTSSMSALGHHQTFSGDASNDRFVAGTRHRRSGFRIRRREGRLTSRKRTLRLGLSKVRS